MSPVTLLQTTLSIQAFSSTGVQFAPDYSATSKFLQISQSHETSYTQALKVLTSQVCVDFSLAFFLLSVRECKEGRNVPITIEQAIRQ